MERILRLPDNSVVKNGKLIDEFLSRRRSLQDRKKENPPKVVLQDINLDKAQLVLGVRKTEGIIEIPQRGDKPYEDILSEIPDLTINLSPEEMTSDTLGDYKLQIKTPRYVIPYDLIEGSKVITIDVKYDKFSPEYRRNCGDTTTIEELVRRNLLTALTASKWICDQTGTWSVTK